MTGNIQVKTTSDNAILPKRATSGAVGYDLFSVSSIVIQPGERGKVDTGISLTPPHGTYAQIHSKSSYASSGVFALGGVIDPDYTGTIFVILLNCGKEPFYLSPGQKVAQVIFHPYVTPEIERVDELNPTTRGSGGFGSTGIFDEDTSTTDKSKKRGALSNQKEEDEGKKQVRMMENIV